MKNIVNPPCEAGGASVYKYPVLGINRDRVSFPVDLTC